MQESDDEFGATSKIYRQFFQMDFEWPCLSFDVIRDDLGASRLHFPHTAYFISATQSDPEDADAVDKLIVTKLSNLQCTKYDDDVEDGSTLVDPLVRCCGTGHPGPATRVRSMPQQSNIIATWTEEGCVALWDVSGGIAAANTDGGDVHVESICECGVDDTGFGLAWSRLTQGQLAIGQNSGVISVWTDAGGAFTCLVRLEAHASSVEDIVFSPKEAGLFATCSSDQTIAIWDSRTQNSAPVMRWTAHESDVNVIDWNSLQPSLICSGADDGKVRVWDLRTVNSDQPTPAASIDYHEDPITSIEWNPADEAEFAVSCEDGRVTVWDLSVEPADMDEREDGIPDQLMFEHICQDPKELHYHPQIPSMIAVTGVNFEVFIPDIHGDPGDDPGNSGSCD
jgi:ribosome assembly protein RRB1